jgi:hypothetical protein
MAKSLRARRVLVDWSQNTEHKSMVCAYSVRARERVADCGDLFKPVLTLRQQLRAPRF